MQLVDTAILSRNWWWRSVDDNWDMQQQRGSPIELIRFSYIINAK